MWDHYCSRKNQQKQDVNIRKGSSTSLEVGGFGSVNFQDNSSILDHHTDPIPNNSSILFAVFYLPIENNMKHPLQFYQRRMQQTCTFLRRFGAPVIALGNPGALRSIPGCDWLSEVDGGTYTISDLRHANVSSIPIKHSCSKKFSGTKDKSKNVPLQREILQIWLNKIDILADLADSHQEKLVIWIDAGLPQNRHPTVEKLVEVGLHDPRNQSMWVSTYDSEKIKKIRTWFGNEQCTTPPVVSACMLAFRGHAGKRVRDVYRQKMAEIARSADEGSDDVCSCFDEESVLSKMYRDMPSEISIVGV
eukprot:CAMPEP_0201934354 /NCGR_PEP_ID=MMETSP0903-20130614/33433_1 /ASSEMBLY_ACC=CAM_ASM_000552 /TAXON_ID=420261 /ORGANISM="Thalassiosira antarctica, Strain CCMP982" /LENGTH=304 /DNA_ID=CAMNT_0048474551 /DNA_START=1 /DNA_END=915 /DNA_ORIENTATION=-